MNSENLPQKHYKDGSDIISSYIEEIKKCLDYNLYFAALYIALTLPDTCGKAEYPTASPSERYDKWYNKYIGDFEKPISKIGEDMPYLSGEVICSFRNYLLHTGTPNMDKNYKKLEDNCRIDDFEIVLSKSIFDGDISYVEPNFKSNTKKRAYSVNIKTLCLKICRAVEDYYIKNKPKFDFIKYNIDDKDYENDCENLLRGLNNGNN